MQNKIIYIAIIIVLSFVLFVLFRPIACSTQKQQSTVDTTYTIGITQQHYKQGKDSITTKTKLLHATSILSPSAADSSYSFSTQDSSYKLSLNINPATAGNLYLEYFLDIKSKELFRIDTIFQTRIDTLKIKEVIIEKEDPPFYNTFLFGSLTTALLIILLIHLIP